MPSASRHAARTPFALIVLGLLAAGLITLLVLNTLLAQDAFRLHDLQRRGVALSEREQLLNRSVNDLQAPAALAARARALGMGPATDPLFLRLSDGAVLGGSGGPPKPKPTPKPAAPAPPAPVAAAAASGASPAQPNAASPSVSTLVQTAAPAPAGSAKPPAGRPSPAPSASTAPTPRPTASR
ncbi:MAG: cell division protein FtsL [Actinomycetota bacterium]|nr:cell division protein FtsL [Actinomycetota bacterium]